MEGSWENENFQHLPNTLAAMVSVRCVPMGNVFATRLNLQYLYLVPLKPFNTGIPSCIEFIFIALRGQCVFKN